MAQDLEVTRTFLETLFGDIPAPWRFTVSRGVRGDWKAWRFLGTEIGDAVRLVSTVDDDWYICAGLHKRALKRGNRGPAHGYGGIVGCWADIDAQTPARGTTRLFPTVEHIQQFMQELPLHASVTVYSGGGLQPWWLFREAWIFDDDMDDREKAERTVRGWLDYVRGRAKRYDAEIDPVHSFEHLLRLPGTTNTKYGCLVR